MGGVGWGALEGSVCPCALLEKLVHDWPHILDLERLGTQRAAQRSVADTPWVSLDPPPTQATPRQADMDR